ncbi:glycosyltransferase [Halapricum desulfuricans]|uniref:Glycosyltransferase n=1 Tax=Halapricum desulfuricans TaxID=2841257 RepID=A0A897N9N2_9EURY|nr:glycosyltransferase [Halapricum desulfuricans]QSG07086.1 Glycosyltransferase [Halapricum desulfuricans]
MRVLLFDLHDAGYHLEFGSRIVDALHDPAGGLTVDLLTTAVTERHEQLFPADRLIEASAFDPGTDDRGTDAYRRAAVDAAFRVAGERDYDVVHFVEVDDVLEYLYQHAESGRPSPAVVGTLDGGRFFRNTRRHRVVSAAMRTGPGAALLQRIHRATLGDPERAQSLKDGLYAAAARAADASAYRERFDRALFEDALASVLSPPMLANCVDAGAFDRLIVKSVEAAEYVRGIDPRFATERLAYLPDTLELWTDLPDQSTARERLGIETDGTVLLQFGEFRHEKGVDVLLEALSGYDGPPFTLVLAGKPVDVTAEDVQAAKRRTSVPIHDVLAFVPDEDVPLYYAAADGVVVPYRPAFGLRRTSGPFLKACGAGKPVLAPAFGFFDRQVRDRNLGLTFVPEDPDDLRRKLARFAADPAATYDPDSMRTFASERTFERVAEDLREVYETTATSALDE